MGRYIEKINNPTFLYKNAIFIPSIIIETAKSGALRREAVEGDLNTLL